MPAYTGPDAKFYITVWCRRLNVYTHGIWSEFSSVRLSLSVIYEARKRPNRELHPISIGTKGLTNRVENKRLRVKMEKGGTGTKEIDYNLPVLN